MSTHQSTELLADTVEGAETVVLGKGFEEVLDDAGLIGTGDLGELLNNGLLVGIAQGRGTEDVDELLVGLEGFTEGSDGAGGLVESGRLGRGSVLFIGRLVVYVYITIEESWLMNFEIEDCFVEGGE